MGESYLIRKSPSGLKLEGTQITRVADENIVANEPIDIVSSSGKIIKATSTGDSERVTFNNNNWPSSGMSFIFSTIPIQNTNKVLILGTRNSNMYDPSVKLYQINENGSATSLSDKIDFNKGQSGTTSIQYRFKGFQLNENTVLVHWSPDNTSRWYGIIKINQDNSITMTQQTLSDFNQNTPVFLVMGKYLITILGTGTSVQLASREILTNGTLSTNISTLSSTSLFGYSSTSTSEHTRILVPVNSTIFAFQTFSQWRGGASSFNNHHFMLYRINLSTGVITKLNDTTDWFPNLNPVYGVAAFQVNATNSMLLYVGSSTQTSAFRIEDTGGTSVTVTTNIPVLIDMSTLGGSTYTADNLNGNINLPFVRGTSRWILLGANSSYQIIPKAIVGVGYERSLASGLSTQEAFNPNVSIFNNNNVLNITATRNESDQTTVNKITFTSFKVSGIALETKNANENVKIIKFNNTFPL